MGLSADLKVDGLLLTRAPGGPDDFYPEHRFQSSQKRAPVTDTAVYFGGYGDQH